MSMTLDVSDDRDNEDLDVDLDDDLDDDGDGRSSRKSDRPGRAKAKRDDTDDDPEDEDDDEDLSEEELRAELKKARAALSRAGKQTARQRAARKALQQRIGSLEGNLDDASDDEDDDEDGKGKRGEPDAKTVQKSITKAVKARERQLQEEHRRDLINTRAETALARAGVSDRNVRLLLKELDMDEVDFDPKSRSIDGLDDEIDRLRDEFPDLFRSKAAKRRINGGDERDRGGKRKVLSASERQAAALRGR